MNKLFAALLTLVASAAFGTTLNPVQLLNPAGSTAGQAIVSTGASSAPGWSNVTASGLVAQAANTVVANATNSTASPTAVVVTGCNGAAQALQWTNGSGFGCNSNIATSGANANITSLSGLSTPLSVAQGGTGVTTSTGSGSVVLSASPTFTGTATFNALATGSATISGGSLNGTPVGATTPSTGAFTTLSASSTVSGTGFSTYFASPPALGGTAANTGKFTTLQTTGAYTPSSTAGIVGTTLGDNANAGSVGEKLSVQTLRTTTSLTNATPANLASMSLSAGDWNVSCTASYSPAGTTNVIGVLAGISTTSASFGAQGTFTQLSGTLGTGSQIDWPTPIVTENVTTSTTVYCVGQLNFNTSTATGGATIIARRIR